MFERKKILFPGDFNQHFKFGHSAFGCVPKHNGIVQTVKYSLLILYAYKCNAFTMQCDNQKKNIYFFKNESYIIGQINMNIDCYVNNYVNLIQGRPATITIHSFLIHSLERSRSGIMTVNFG